MEEQGKCPRAANGKRIWTCRTFVSLSIRPILCSLLKISATSSPAILVDLTSQATLPCVSRQLFRASSAAPKKYPPKYRQHESTAFCRRVQETGVNCTQGGVATRTPGTERKRLPSDRCQTTPCVQVLISDQYGSKSSTF